MTAKDLQVIRDIEAAIYQLPTIEQEACDAYAKELRATIKAGGTKYLLAFALVGAELQAGIKP